MDMVGGALQTTVREKKPTSMYSKCRGLPRVKSCQSTGRQGDLVI